MVTGTSGRLTGGMGQYNWNEMTPLVQLIMIGIKFTVLAKLLIFPLAHSFYLTRIS